MCFWGGLKLLFLLYNVSSCFCCVFVFFFSVVFAALVTFADLVTFLILFLKGCCHPHLHPRFSLFFCRSKIDIQLVSTIGLDLRPARHVLLSSPCAWKMPFTIAKLKTHQKNVSLSCFFVELHLLV